MVPKQKNEILGVVIVESGWGSMLPTVVIANLMPGGPAARSNQLNIGDHIITINGISLVGLPLSECQNHIRVSGLFITFSYISIFAFFSECSTLDCREINSRTHGASSGSSNEASRYEVSVGLQRSKRSGKLGFKFYIRFSNFLL